MFVFSSCLSLIICLFFFFNDTATTEIYTLSLHDALPISLPVLELEGGEVSPPEPERIFAAELRRQKAVDVEVGPGLLAEKVGVHQQKYRRQPSAARGLVVQQIIQGRQMVGQQAERHGKIGDIAHPHLLGEQRPVERGAARRSE